MNSSNVGTYQCSTTYRELCGVTDEKQLLMALYTDIDLGSVLMEANKKKALITLKLIHLW